MVVDVMECPAMRKLKQQLQQLATLLLLGILSACTVQQARIPAGSLPEASATTLLEEEHADAVLEDLREDYVVDDSSRNYYLLLDQFSRLATGSGVNPDDWRIYLFDAPDVVDLRAIPGNTLFVWSGLFDAIEAPGELAGLLACELAHDLASHTDPVEFGLGSELMFGLTDIAASVGIMVLTQGMVAVSGAGMTRWLYVEATDLDELDRVYNQQQVEEMADIALLIMTNAEYSPDGLLGFWQRAAADPALEKRLQRLHRKLPPGERVALLESAMSRQVTLPVGETVDGEVADAYPGSPWL
jgi:predicted Zn-dependent protease